jgi:hypothetical protein
MTHLPFASASRLIAIRSHGRRSAGHRVQVRPCHHAVIYRENCAGLFQGSILAARISDMGNSQSNSSDVVVQEKLVEQPTPLQLKNRVRQPELEKEYVKFGFKASPTTYWEDSQIVSISAAEQWEKELLEDPKNRHVSL